LKIQFLFILLAFIFVLSSNAQSLVSGKIIENTKKGSSISNAVLITNQQRYFFSNHAGEFEFLLKPNEYVDRILAKDFLVYDQKKSSSLIEMQPSKGPIGTPLKRSKIAEVTKQQVATVNFKFKSFSKTVISNEAPDFVLRKDSDFRLTQSGGLQQKINAISVEGLEGVVPKMVTKDIHFFNWFQTYIKIFEEQFISPFNTLNKANYEFYLIYEDAQVEIIGIEPVLKGFQRSFKGVLVLDKSSLKFKKIQVTLDADYRLTLSTEFDDRLGLPVFTELFISPGQGGKRVSFFEGGLDFGRIQKKNPKQDKAKLIHQQIYFDHKSGDTIAPFLKQLSKTLEDRDHTVPYGYWEELNYDFIKGKALDTSALKLYLNKENVKNRVKRISAFDAGYLSIGRVDVDLTRLVKLNNFEGLRLGLGLQSNQSFSEKYRIGGFAAYGTQDGNFKYGFNVGKLLNADTSTWLNAFYDNDIEEVGANSYLTDQRVYSLFEPRLVNITFFYKYKKYGLSLQHNFTPQLMSELKVDKNNISQTRTYAFENDGNLFENYNLTTATFGLRWTPNTTYSKVGERIYIDDKFTPEITAQLSQSIEGVLDGDFSFTKLSAKIDYDFQHSWGSLSSIELGGDLGFGDIPLMHAFHAFPNSPNKPTIGNRFSVAGVKSFETMYFNEFFSTKLATLHLKHRLTPFKLSNAIQPELVLISRHAIGDFQNPELHQNIAFNTLSQGYNEAGLEINKLFFGFGLSFAYRYGAYHLPEFEDNFSLKFTFYLKL
jgi:hypothetical protein